MTHIEETLGITPKKDEKVEDFPTFGVGAYTGVVGRIYDEVFQSGFERTTVDVLIMKSSQNEVERNHTKYETNGDKVVISLLQGKDGNPITGGVIYKLGLGNPATATSDGARQFLSANRRIFAEKMGCWDKDKESIKWNQLQNMAGSIITFEIIATKSKRDGKTYLNPDIDSLMRLESLATVESVASVYKKLAELKETTAKPQDDEPPF